jgi:uncharacterized protein YbgA (DUF1722 family)/uncharacterized protein YbbK (DUF523 family)
MKPRVVVSACLGFEACRYNGAVIPNRFLRDLDAYVELVRVCPEVEIGLGTPRDPIRIELEGDRRLLVQPTTGRDITEDMEQFASTWLDRLDDVDGFVLKTRSPSCGVQDAKRYLRGKGPKPMRAGSGPGLFAEAALERFPNLPMEDEGRLTNLRLREHFLTRIFTTTAFRAVRRRRSMSSLVTFHAENKLLFMAANQTRMRVLGRTTANADRLPLPEVLDRYEAELRLLLATPPRTPSHVNVALHALGYFKDGLTAREKAHFLDALETYREGRAPLSVVTALLASWVVRFDEDYLARQTWFHPFPPELVDATDSGKGRAL